MDELTKKLAEQNEAMTAKFAEWDTKATNMASENESLRQRLIQMEQIAAPRRAMFSLPGVNEQKEQFSFLRAVAAISTGDWANAGFEKEILDNMQKKAMSAGNDTAGGYIVPSEYIPELIELLYSNTVLMKLGATVLSGLTSSPIEIPKQTGGATAYWIEENEAITPSELTVGQIRMTPRAVAAMVKLSNRLIRMSNPSAEAMVRRDIALTLAQAIDIAGFRGSGVASQPLGIVNTDDINTVEIGPNGGPATFDTLIDMAYELEVDNALRGNLSYVFSPGVKRTLIQSKVAQYSGDTGGQYVVQPITDSALNGYVGYPYRTTTVLPTNLVKGTSTDCTEIIFANWQEMIIAQWAGLQIMASTETSDAFERNQTWIRIIQEVDFAVRHPQSFCVCNDARV